MNIKEYLQQHPQWKKRIHGFIMHPVKTRPYWWIRVWQPFYIKKGRGSVIYSSVRKDLPPFHLFQMGKYSVVEDFSCLNNAVGDIVIGDYCRIGLDHNYQDITQGIIEQGITTSPIHIGEHTIIGANVIVLPGITIGKHCFIGAGCVVTQNIPDYCVTVGNPARIIKRYNPHSQTWEKI